MTLDEMTVHMFLDNMAHQAEEGKIEDREENKRLGEIFQRVTGADPAGPLAKYLYAYASGMGAGAQIFNDQEAGDLEAAAAYDGDPEILLDRIAKTTGADRRQALTLCAAFFAARHAPELLKPAE